MQGNTAGPVISWVATSASAAAAPSRAALHCGSGKSSGRMTHTIGGPSAGSVLSAAIMTYPIIREIEELHRVHDRDVRAGSQQPGADLHGTSRITRCHDVGPGVDDGAGLSPQDRTRQSTLCQGVASGAAATQFRLCVWHMLETRDGVEDHPWGICDSLCVEEMTGRIVSDSDVQETAFHGTARAQELRNVSDSVRECLGRGVITEQPPVFFEHRTTSSAVDGNRSVRRIRESLEVVPSQRDCRLVLAGVGMECAAATLPGCFEDLVPVGPEYALCGGVHVVEEALHDAASKHDCRPSAVRGGR